MKPREQIATILRDVQSLPTLPDVAVRVLRMSDDQNVSAVAICSVVEKDPAIATKLLRMVNSPFYGIRREVTSVQQALIILGVTNLRNLVLSTSVMDLFDQTGSVGEFSRKDLWTHCVGVAAAAREMARRQRLVDPEVAFTAGLIHDVGKVVIDRYFHEDFEEVIRIIHAQPVTMAAAESAVLGVDHSEVGYYVAERWNLPSVLCEAIGYHHAPAEAPNHLVLPALVSVSDALVRRTKIGDGGGSDPLLDDETLRLCKLTPEQFEVLASEFGGELSETAEQLVAVI